MPTASTVVAKVPGALNEQQSGCDPDVADVLQFLVGNELYRQIERTETLLELLDPTAAVRKPDAGLGELEVLQ